MASRSASDFYLAFDFLFQGLCRRLGAGLDRLLAGPDRVLKDLELGLQVGPLASSAFTQDVLHRD